MGRELRALAACRLQAAVADMIREAGVLPAGEGSAYHCDAEVARGEWNERTRATLSERPAA